MAKVSLTKRDLEAHLADQIQLLELSAENFDQGTTAEYRRLAVGIRVLVHHTSKSHSLLSQLDRGDISFEDTALPLPPTTVRPHNGLTTAVIGGPNQGHAAALGPSTRSVSFQEWWNAEVLRDIGGRRVTRRDLILTAANQDGGSHVDPELDEVYADISRENSMGTFFQTPRGLNPIQGIERSAIRQIAHEVLLTLKPGFSKQQNHSDALFVLRGFSVS